MTTLDPNREIYANAPLKLVTCELRWTEMAQLTLEQERRFGERLDDFFPIAGPAPHQDLRLGPDGPSAVNRGVRRFSDDRRWSASLAPRGLSVESSQYGRFEDFLEIVGHVLAAAEAAQVRPAVARLGLRYIDEIDEIDLPAGADWSAFIEADLDSALRTFNPPPDEFQAAVVFEEPEQRRNLVLRYGLMRQPAVDPAGALIITRPPRGRYFLIDIDSALEPEPGESHPLDASVILMELAELHAPVRRAFERMITDELRNTVLRKVSE